jgi:hypothetical protein
VIAIPDEKWSERPLLVVVTKPPAKGEAVGGGRGCAGWEGWQYVCRRGGGGGRGGRGATCQRSRWGLGRWRRVRDGGRSRTGSEGEASRLVEGQCLCKHQHCWLCNHLHLPPTVHQCERGHAPAGMSPPPPPLHPPSCHHARLPCNHLPVTTSLVTTF